jgi:hypothetical protein
MTERNEHEERGDRRVFEPAIARLREELANLERQASATRALIEALVVRAGATDLTQARTATAKAPPREQHRSSRATANTQKGAPAPTTRHVPTNTAAAVGAHGAKELAEIVAAVTRSQRDAEAAIRSKDVARLKTAVAVIAHAERRGGELLVKLGGQFKPLPVSPADRKRWREAAARTPAAFDAKLKRDIATALARIGGNAATAVNKAKPPSRPPKPPSALTAPHLQAKLSDWHQEPDGSLTRTLTTVAKDDAATAPAGA